MNWFNTSWFRLDTLLSFQWADGLYLYGLVLIPFLFVLRVWFNNRGRQKLQVAFVARGIRQDWVQYLRFLPPIFVALGLVALTLALARPQRTTQRIERTATGIEIVLALDVSDSMLEKDLVPNRLEAAKKLARKFIQGRFQDKIGLVVFAGESFFLCPLTTDYDLLQSNIDEIQPNIIRYAGTALGAALANCINLMRDTDTKTKVAILLSDGNETAGNLDYVTAAQLAKAYGVKVYTIAIGQGVETDASALQKISAISEGRSFQAANLSELSKIFSVIDRLEKVKIKQTSYQETQDFYRIYLYWGLLFLLIGFLLKSTFVGNILED